MAHTILANSAKKSNMNVEDFVADVLPAFRANYENAKQDHKEFWEGFTPGGGEADDGRDCHMDGEEADGEAGRARG